MKKYTPYIIGGMLLLVLVLTVILAPIQFPKRMDERVTLRQKDKIPYGTYAAYHLLPQLFPSAKIESNNLSPASWAGDSILTNGQVVFITARYFDPTKEELRLINRFIKSGNHVFLITNSFSYDAAEHFGVSGAEYLYARISDDSLEVRLKNPPFKSKLTHIYPGKKFDAYFTEVDPTRAFALGTDENGHTNFLQLASGTGKLYIHLAPLAFSNYFLLHRQNVGYLQQVLSLVPANINKVTWNEYYLIQRKKSREKEPNVLNVLWQFPSFKWALVTAMAFLLLYALVEMRRRQRLIPVVKAPVNDSLDFVRTLGRLYYDKGDHHNLAKKMATYFLDEVRTRYHISTQKLDADFVTELHAKSGHPVQGLQDITLFIDRLEENNIINENELALFYQQLDLFYQTIGNGRTTF